jgi:hypothetical protein
MKVFLSALALSAAAVVAAPAKEPEFALLATQYTQAGPVIFVLDSGITGSACIAAITRGITPDHVRAVSENRIKPAPEAHVPTRADEVRARLADAVLSCELAW